MTDREAMQQALAALEEIADEVFSPYDNKLGDAILALRERLAQCDRCGKRLGGEGDIHTCTPKPEQEPVAWAHKEGLESIKDFDASIYANGGFDDAVPLFTAPAQRTWVGLTSKDIIEMWPQTSTVGWDDIRLIEAKLKEKNP